MAAPKIDPTQATEAAFALYDKNSDGKIADDELNSCPALLQHRKQYDPDGNGVTREEFQARISNLFGKHTPALTTVTLQLTSRGRPMDGAEVRFIPEPFLGDQLKEAVGTTNRQGRATIAIPDESLPESQQGLNLMQVGIFRVEIDHPSLKDEKKFGWEVNAFMRGGTDPHIDVAR